MTHGEFLRSWRRSELDTVMRRSRRAGEWSASAAIAWQNDDGKLAGLCMRWAEGDYDAAEASARVLRAFIDKETVR